MKKVIRPITAGKMKWEDAMRWSLGIAFILAVGSHPAAAEQNIQRFVCTFDQHVSPEGGPFESDLLRFEFVVDGTGHAFAIGKNVYSVEVVTGDQGLTFLEVLITGAVQTTTVHMSGAAVHSRHTMLSITGDLVPSQYYGTCK